MHELVKVQKQVIGNGEVNAVNARDLHTFLESKQEFAHWIKGRIGKYGFVENVEYNLLDKKIMQVSGAKYLKEYIISLPMAKELAMVENNEKGKQARRYFIECETKLKEVTKHPALPMWEIEGNGVVSVLSRYNAPAHLIATEQFKHILNVGGPDLRNMVGELPCSQDIATEDMYLEPTELGMMFNLTPTKMNKTLADIGFQYKDKKRWLPTDRGAEFCTRHLWNRGGKSGYNYKWNIEKVKEQLKWKD